MQWKEGPQFENAPVGSHIARCTGLIDLGTQPHTFQGQTKTSRDVRLIWELPNTRMTGKYNPEHKGKIFQISLTTNASLHPKSKLRQYLDQWRGKAMTKEEVAVFQPKKLLGAVCRLTLIEKGEYVNITGVSPLSKEEAATVPKQVNPILYFSLDPNEFDSKVFAGLSEKLREKIKSSPEFRALNSEGDSSVPVDDEGGDDEGGAADPWS